ncbi:unnamed protein product, partial [Effrenium voratum]
EAEQLVSSQLPSDRLARQLARPMLSCVTWFNERVLHPLSIREVLAWSAFVRNSVKDTGLASAVEMYLHGGCMTLVDSLGLGNQLVDTQCLSAVEEDDANAGGLSKAQRAILRHLLQLEAFELGSEAREELKAAFGHGGFAW